MKVTSGVALSPENLRWLHDNARCYFHGVVMLQHGTLVAHGRSGEEVYAAVPDATEDSDTVVAHIFGSADDPHPDMWVYPHKCLHSRLLAKRREEHPLERK